MSKANVSKGTKEEFASFFEDPTRESLREALKNQTGEQDIVDFKKEWQDFPRMAHLILGLANSGGGCIVLGVAENNDHTYETTGIIDLKDKVTIKNSLEKYLPSNLISNYKVLDFSYEDSEYPKIKGKKFQVIIVEDDPKHLPFVSNKDGNGIKKNTIYFRVGTSTEPANYDQIQKIINRRIETGYSSQREINLQEHVEQLKILYGFMDKYDYVVSQPGIIEKALSATFKPMEQVYGKREKIAKETYPKEDFEEFLAVMIAKTKKRIEIELDVVDLIVIPVDSPST